MNKVRLYRKEQPDGQRYDPHPDDPPALRIPCPVCIADVGDWCGGFNDIHDERLDAQERGNH